MISHASTANASCLDVPKPAAKASPRNGFFHMLSLRARSWSWGSSSRSSWNVSSCSWSTSFSSSQRLQGTPRGETAEQAPHSVLSMGTSERGRLSQGLSGAQEGGNDASTLLLALQSSIYESLIHPDMAPKHIVRIIGTKDFTHSFKVCVIL